MSVRPTRARLTRWLPFLGWPQPDRATLRGEVVAGLTVAMFVIPQGVAYAARQAGVRCWVSMLATAAATKIDAVRGYGAEVVLHQDPATWFEGVEALRAQKGAILIDAWADAGLIAGYGSIGGEILEDLPDVEVVVVPVGGGTLISGIAAFVIALSRVRPLGAARAAEWRGPLARLRERLSRLRRRTA